MFDFIIKTGKDGKLSNPFKENPFYRRRPLYWFSRELPSFTIHGLSHQNENPFWEDEHYFLAVCGQVFYRFGCGLAEKIAPAALAAQLIENQSEFLKKIKGLFKIILFHKSSGRLTLLIDPLAMNPAYYFTTNGCLLAATNLSLFKPYTQENPAAVLEKLLFGYPLDNKTFLRNVSAMQGGEILDYYDQQLKLRSYFNLREFVFNGQYHSFQPDRYIELFNYSVRQQAGAGSFVMASLTGGFDGRSVVSGLLHQQIPFSTYSFGKKGGENTRVPQTIQSHLPINYTAIELEDAYEKKYFSHAADAIYFSDGLSLNERANYMYAFHQLTGQTKVVLTGLVGGELLRPIYRQVDYLNELYYRVFYQQGSFAEVEEAFEKNLLPYLKPNLLAEYRDGLRQTIEKRQTEIRTLQSAPDGYLYYYYDLLKTGFRQFYGSEMHMERIYAETLTPFLDLDGLSYLLHSDYKKIFRHAFKKSLLLRWRGQLLYAHLFRHNCPLLGTIPVDRSYAPDDLLSVWKRLRIPLAYFSRKRKLEKSPREFTSDVWSTLFYQNYPPLTASSDLFNLPALQKFMDTYQPRFYKRRINSILSLYYWLKVLP